MREARIPDHRRSLRCRSRRLALGLASAALVAVLPPRADAIPQTVCLRNGSEIKAELLDRSPDRVVVDLGFDVVAIPAVEIEKIVAPGAEPQDSLVREDGLFRVSSGNGRSVGVAENAARLGAAVVQVRTPTGLGSGFVINPEGYIVTNEHVVAGEYELSVTVFERANDALEKTQYNNVRILALDPRIDLALLKIEDTGGRKFASVTIGDWNELRDGETVFAIGSPLGLDRTVSQGIVSLKNRPLNGQLYIQTTAQINPGNSGGPLFNLRGEVVGVNNMKAMAVGVEGVSFAIPATTLEDFLRNRDAFAFDPRNPNAGFRYLEPPRPRPTRTK